MNSKRGIKNIIFGLLYQFVVLAFGLIMPRLLIVSYGSEVNGLLSSVNQLYSCLALLETGVGTASLQALYRTVGTQDRAATCGVMAATDHFYKRTGLLYLACVLLLTFIYPAVVSSGIPYLTCAAVIFLLGISGVVNYLVHGKYRILLQAEGKSYLLSNLSTCTYVLSNLAKAVLIYLGFNVVTVQLVYVAVTMLQVGYISLHIARHYKWLDLSVSPDFQSISQKNAVLVHQIAGLVFSNTDVLILTFVSGLKTVSVYTLFAGLYGVVKSLLFSILDGIKFAMGQKFHKDFSGYVRLHDIFELYYMALTFAAYTVLHILILPFLRIYTRGITDISYIDKYLPVLFTAVFLLQCARGPAGLAIDYAEHFEQTKKRAVLEMAINLAVTVAAVFRFGIYGALIGTIAALLYRANDMIIYANRVILNRSPWITYRRWLIDLVLFLAINSASRCIEWDTPSYLVLFGRGAALGACVLAAYLTAVSVLEPKTFREAAAFIRNWRKP